MNGKGSPSTLGSTDAQTFRHLMTKYADWEYFSKIQEGLWGCERRMFWAVFSRLTDSCRTSRGLSANTPSDAQPSPLGDRPHGPGMTKLRGCSQPSLGAWPLRVIDRRSKRHFLRGDLWGHWHGRALLRAYGVKTIPEITISLIPNHIHVCF